MRLDQRHQRALVNAVVAAATTAIVGLIVVSLLPEGKPSPIPHPTAESRSPVASCEPSWDRVPSPDPEDGGTLLTAVTVVAPDDAWAVGGSGDPVAPTATLAIRWNGAEWDLVATPNAGSVSNRFDAVDALSPDAAWAVGSASSGAAETPITAQWDGATWTMLPMPPDLAEGALLGVEAFSTDDVWAVGYEGDATIGLERALALHWNGLEWSRAPVRPALGGGRSTLTSVAGTSGTDVWAVGSARNRPVIVHWDGTAWTASPSEVRGEVRDVTAFAPDDVWVVGERIQHWDGTAWDQAGSVRRGALLTSVAGVGPSDVWVVGTRPSVDGIPKPLVLRWNGLRWSRVPGPGVAGAVTLTGVSALPDGTVHAVGYRDDERGRTTLAIVGTTCPPEGP